MNNCVNNILLQLAESPPNLRFWFQLEMTNPNNVDLPEGTRGPLVQTTAIKC